LSGSIASDNAYKSSSLSLEQTATIIQKKEYHGRHDAPDGQAGAIALGWRARRLRAARPFLMIL
jgi:hypothetical protein